VVLVREVEIGGVIGGAVKGRRMRRGMMFSDLYSGEDLTI
jgi:hypothetical protein